MARKKSEAKEVEEEAGLDDSVNEIKETKKEHKKEGKEEETILTSVDDYVKTAAYLGTKVITPSMRQYVYRRRMDGLAILTLFLLTRN